MRAKLTAKHPRPTTSERAPVRRGSTTARKQARPAPAAPVATKRAESGSDSASTRRGSEGGPAGARAGARPATSRTRDAAAKPARPRGPGDRDTGARRDGDAPTFRRREATAGGERKAASSADNGYARTGRPARSDADTGGRRRDERTERAPRFAGSRERDERPERRGDGERPARGAFRDGERPARPRREGDAPEKRGYAGERRPPRANDNGRPAFGRERDERPARRSDGERGAFRNAERPRRDGDAPEKRGYANDRRPARANDDARPAFRGERDERPVRRSDGERPPRGAFRDAQQPARPRRDGDAPEKRPYANDRRPARANDDARPAFRGERDERPVRRSDGERPPRGAFRDAQQPARPRRDGDAPEKRAYASDRRPARANDDGRPTTRRDRDDADRRPAGDRRAARPPVKATYGERSTTSPGAARSAGAAASRSADAAGSLRLAKRMSELGLCSRREADEWIEKGWVYVDGERIDTLGAKITPDQKIEIDPAARAAQARLVTVLLHKPVGYVSGQAEDGYEPAITLVTGENHWDGDRSGLRFSPLHLRALAPAGRLDIDSTGLLVLTQDGRIAKQLIGEQSDVDKEYLVRVTYDDIETDIDQHFPPESLAKLRHGLSLDDVPLKPAMVSWQNGEQLRFVLREGKKRQIRRMCELVGLKVVGLKRVRIGHVLLGALPQGQWRYMTPDETF